MKRYALFSVAVTLLVSGSVRAQIAKTQPEMATTPEQLAEQGARRVKQYQDYRPDMPTYPDMEAVRRLAEIGRARGKATHDALMAATRPPAAPKAGERERQPITEGLVVVALSSSMPKQMLRDYFAQLDGKPGVVVVLRGFVDGAQKVAPTGQWLKPVMLQQASCDTCGYRNVNVVVDPLVYRSLNIRQVPAVTYLAGVQALGHCEREVYEASRVAVGAASVGSALVALSRAGMAVPASVISGFGG